MSKFWSSISKKNQTVRLTHDSIKREAFGTGAIFALGELAACDIGFYTFDDLLMKKLKQQLSGNTPNHHDQLASNRT